VAPPPPLKLVATVGAVSVLASEDEVGNVYPVAAGPAPSFVVMTILMINVITNGRYYAPGSNTAS